MKNQLLIALCAGASIYALTPSACAEAKAPALKMSGFTSIIGLGASQKQKQNGKGGADPSFAISASDLRLTVDGKSVNDFGYKCVGSHSLRQRRSLGIVAINILHWRHSFQSGMWPVGVVFINSIS